MGKYLKRYTENYYHHFLCNIVVAMFSVHKIMQDVTSIKYYGDR